MGKGDGHASAHEVNLSTGRAAGKNRATGADLARRGAAYGSFVALPLLLVAPETLWRPGPPGRRPPFRALILTGFAAAFVIRLIWGFVWAPFATWAFDLPPNPVP